MKETLSSSETPFLQETHGITSQKTPFFLKGSDDIYKTKNQTGSGLCPTPGILKTGEHRILETGPVSILKAGEGDTYSVRAIRTM
jgi:hypothetical protein